MSSTKLCSGHLQTLGGSAMERLLIVIARHPLPSAHQATFLFPAIMTEMERRMSLFFVPLEAIGTLTALHGVILSFIGASRQMFRFPLTMTATTKQISPSFVPRQAHGTC